MNGHCRRKLKWFSRRWRRRRRYQVLSTVRRIICKLFFSFFSTHWKNENWSIKFRRKTFGSSHPLLTRSHSCWRPLFAELLVFGFKWPITMYTTVYVYYPMIETLFDEKFPCRFHLDLYTLHFHRWDWKSKVETRQANEHLYYFICSSHSQKWWHPLLN